MSTQRTKIVTHVCVMLALFCFALAATYIAEFSSTSTTTP